MFSSILSAKISVCPVSFLINLEAVGFVIKATFESCNPVGFFFRILSTRAGLFKSITPWAFA